MAKYINYWLKDMIKDTPNNMELGEKLREISWKQTKKQIVKDENQPYIYERNPDTGVIRSRKITEYNNTKIDNNKKENNMEKISLYDYLGHAAGSDVGQQVAFAAAKAGVITETKQVSNPVYKGPVMLYPRSFLDLYFKGGLNEGTSGKQLLKG